MQFHLIDQYHIVQGASYPFALFYPNLDLSTWIVRSHIRKTPNDTKITEFNIKPIIYGTREGHSGTWSTILFYLNASQTMMLPVTKPRKPREAFKEGINVICYDVEAEDPNDSENVIKLISKSYIEVIEEVTYE